MDYLIGVVLMVIIVLVYVLLGLGEGGATCHRCENEEPSGASRVCPLRMLDSVRKQRSDVSRDRR